MILLVNQFITPVFLDIANAFAQSGYETKVFTGSIENGNAAINPKIKIVRSICYRRGSTVMRFVTWLGFSAHLAVRLIWAKKPDAILVVTNPPIAPWVIHYFAKWKKVPYYLLVYDLYPEALDQGGFVTSRSFIYQKWSSFNHKLFGSAKKVFTLSDSMKDACKKYLHEDSIKVISNWVDSSYIHPLPKDANPFVQKYVLDKKTTILYAGNMGFTHDLESVVEAAYLLRENKIFQFLFVGEGGKRARLEELCRTKSISNVLFLPYQSAEQFPLLMGAADIGVVTLGVGAEGISVPSKTYVNMAAGLALLTIAPKNSELCRIVEQYNVGMVCEPGHPEKVVENLILMTENPGILKAYKENARKAAMDFTPKNAFEYVNEISL